jgi:deoxyadenosine/deoxycytidine kinase
MDYNFIVIEGNIGAGKTSLATKIASEYNAKLILERFADNPFLPKFYEDSVRYAFPLEMSFLAERYHQLKTELQAKELFTAFTISDYFFMKSIIFAQNTLEKDEFNLYRNLFNIIYHTLHKPDLYVYLYLTPENLLKNIKKRGRDYEQNISKEYLETIQAGYFEYFKKQQELTILIIDTNNIDFIENPTDYFKIIEVIFKQNYQKGINRIIL